MSLLARVKSLFGLHAAQSSQEMPDAEDAFWQEVYDARHRFYQQHFGDCPDDILKVGHLFGVWPGGGLFVIPCSKIEPNLYAYTTFGLTNPDMPTTTTLIESSSIDEGQGRPSQFTASLGPKKPAETPPGTAGYGYELVLLAKENAQWPLWVLQWAVNAELLSDAGILNRVEKYGGLTIEGIQVGEAESANFLFAKAKPPLPSEARLPNGKMEVIIGTKITDNEMRWSMENSREVLLDQLIERGVGQISDRQRVSVLP